MHMRIVFSILLFIGTLLSVQAQERSLFDSLTYRAELQGTVSGGDHNPLWLHSNKYGLSSLKNTNGYLRGAIERPLSLDNGRKWGIGYGLDVAVGAGFTSKLIVQQAFVEARWLKGTLTVGAKEYPMELKNQELSSGAQTFGINCLTIGSSRIRRTGWLSRAISPTARLPTINGRRTLPINSINTLKAHSITPRRVI